MSISMIDIDDVGENEFPPLTTLERSVVIPLALEHFGSYYSGNQLNIRDIIDRILERCAVEIEQARNSKE